MDTYIIIDFGPDAFRPTEFKVADCPSTALLWLDGFFANNNERPSDVTWWLSNQPHEEYPLSVYERI